MSDIRVYKARQDSVSSPHYPGDPLHLENIPEYQELLKRVEYLERTLAGIQIFMGKASEYKARPKKGRLPR